MFILIETLKAKHQFQYMGQQFKKMRDIDRIVFNAVNWNTKKSEIQNNFIKKSYPVYVSYTEP